MEKLDEKNLLEKISKDLNEIKKVTNFFYYITIITLLLSLIVYLMNH